MLKVGIIGCGFMGAMHANCYKCLEDVEITALADLRNEKAKELANGTNAQIFADGKDLIANADVDIIDICLPTYLHTEYALLAMDKVKYLFIEKPVALTVKESEELIKKQQETGCNIQVGQVIRFWDEYVKLKEIYNSGKNGKVINANFRRISPTPEWGWKDWLRNPTLSGGAAQDLHIHDIDFVLSMFGEPENLFSVKQQHGEKNGYVNTLMKYNDFVVTVEGTWDLPSTHPFEATFRVVFENAVVENSGGKFMLYTAEGAQEIKIEKNEISSVNAGGNISDLGGYYNELKAFTDCAKNNAEIKEASLTSAAASLKFLLEKELEFDA